MSVQMSESFATALRTELVDRVRAEHAPSRRWSKTRWASLAAVTAGAVAAVVIPIVASGGSTDVSRLTPATPPSGSATPEPGSDVITLLGPTTTIAAAGTRTVELGNAPAGANSIDIKLICLTAARFTVAAGADGSSLLCTAKDLQGDERTRTLNTELTILPGQPAVTISATGGDHWRLAATFSKVVTTAWGINASGQTYGVSNAQGTPDLVSVVATNGRSGYAYASQLQPPNYTSPAQALEAQKHHQSKTLPVYESDGKTVIGSFVFQ